MNYVRWVVLIMAASVMASACGSGGPPPKQHSQQLTFDPRPGQVLFQVSSGAGFAGPSVYLATRPSVTITGSGDAYVLARGAEDGIYEGRPLALLKGMVPSATLRNLVREAEALGLFDGAHYGTVQISDAGDTSFTFRPDRAAARTVSVYALDITDVDGSLTANQRKNRQALRAFERRLNDSVVHPTVWLPSRIDVTAVPDAGAEASAATPWPGPPLDPLLKAHQRGRCGVLSGRAARTVYRAARQYPGTDWVAGGTEHTLVIRALLPGEAGCGD